MTIPQSKDDEMFSSNDFREIPTSKDLHWASSYNNDMITKGVSGRLTKWLSSRQSSKRLHSGELCFYDKHPSPPHA
eukprot:scaffold1946_cov188-Ochromonas_danica.AAC.4